MPLLLLIRHGENDYSRKGRLAGRLPGIHLNERGKQQAQELAKALAEAPIKAIYSSPLERARRRPSLLHGNEVLKSSRKKGCSNQT